MCCYLYILVAVPLQNCNDFFKSIIKYIFKEFVKRQVQFGCQQRIFSSFFKQFSVERLIESGSFLAQKTFFISREMFPEIFSLIDAALSEEVRNKKVTHKLTEILLLKVKVQGKKLSSNHLTTFPLTAMMWSLFSTFNH